MMSHTGLRLSALSGLRSLIFRRLLGVLDRLGLLSLSAVKRMAVGGLTFSLGVVLVFGVTSGLSVAQVVADPNAGGYKPQIIHPNNSNNVPIINITRPNAAGVSRNQYHQLNVGKQGLILNNGMYTNLTHLGGWIDGNPNLAHGQARIILNEVTSGNPSLLRGYIEVGGGRAEVIIANPAGISVNGGGFINASGVTLTTGIPQINQSSGQIESYRVAGGRVSIDGDGLDTQGADFTRIITRAAEVNSGVWAQDLTITAGLGTFSPSGEALELTVLDPSGRPQFAIDVAELGGMYAGKIRLIGTEEGVGVRNAGQIGASVGQVEITASGQLVNTATGRIASHGAGAGIQLKSTQDLINEGSIYTAGGLQANVSNISNSGTFAAGKDVRITAQTTHNQADGLIAGGLNSEGKLATSGGVNIQGQTLNNEGELIAGGDINLNVTQLSNQGSAIHAGNNLEINAQTLDNTNGGKLVSGKDMLLKTTQLNNQAGVISAGQSLKLQGITSASTNNHIDNTSGVIIAGKGLDAKAQSLKNTGGEVLSQGDLDLHLTQGATLDGQIIADNNLNVQVDGDLVNQASLLAGETLDLKSNGLDNQANAQISASKTNINTQKITNRGLIDGGLTYIKTNTLANIGTGRIYGNHLAIEANLLTNTAETVGGQTKAATIAARQRLDLGVQTLKNEKGALISSHGDMAIGGSLDAEHLATGQATLIHNEGATIEADGSLHISAQQINNTNAHFSYVDQHVGRHEDLYKITLDRDYDPSEIVIYNTKTGMTMPAPTSFTGLIATLSPPFTSNAIMINGYVHTSFFIKAYNQDDYVPVTTASSPGQILSGGNMVLDGNVLNDKSRIQAGKDLLMTGNVQTVDAKAKQYSQQQIFIWQKQGDNAPKFIAPASATVNQVEVSLTASTPIKNTPLGGSGTPIGDLNTGIVQDPSGVSTTRPNLGIPEGSLHNITKDKNKGYWIETDPNLINYGSWISSNLILERLGLDPQGVQKRLGDGYYEQKLVREQIGQLTGYRFLAGYDSDDEQYKALLNAGVEFALEHNLSVGIALTSEQMQHLTSDIVWLVSAEVRLPNGQVETVLVPQVYVRSGANMIKSDGALISANNVYIGKNTSTGTSEEIKNKPSLINHATIAARQGLFVDAQELKNLAGQLHGEDVVLRSATDIDNLGGVISAQNSITMMAERDVNITANVVDSTTTLGKRTEVSNIGTVYLAGQEQEAIPSVATQEGAPSTATGQIHIQAGRDVNLKGGMIINDAPSSLPSLPALETPDGQEAAPASTLAKTGQGKTSIVATGNINIGTVSTEHEEFMAADAKNWSYSKGSQEHGSQIFTEGDIELAAGGDLTVRGSSIESSSGSLIGQAQNITVEASQDTSKFAQSSYSKKSSGLSSKSRHSMEMGSGTSLNASSLSAESIHLQAQSDVNIKASQVIGAGDVNLVAQTGDINILSEEEKRVYLSHEKVKQSGISGTGGIGFTIGKSKTTTDRLENETQALGSTVGSLEGDVNLLAQKGDYRQIGSDVLALQGDINVVAQDITIKEARNVKSYFEEQKTKSVGLTISLNTPITDALLMAKQMHDASKKTDDTRMQALAAGTVGLHVYNNAGQITDTVKGVANAFGEDAKSLGEMVKNPSEAGFGSASISVEASLGVSKSSSTSFGVEDQSKGSSISAGGNVNLIATGKDAAGSTPEVPLKEGGNIFIQGSHITGGGDVSLIANKQIDIRAAQNSSFDMGQSKSSSGSISVSYGTQGWGGGVSASKGKGSSIEVDKSWSGSYIDAGGAATLISGGDTNIIGSQVSGDKVQAQIGGDLNIETLQDFSFSHKDEKNSGVSFSTTKGSIGGSVSHSKSNATGLHISASEYAGIMAGDGGYQITVEGNTDLKGGIIASTQEAVNKGKNELTTGSITTSELINISTSKSEGSSISAGASFGWGNTGDNATNNGFKPSTPLSFKGKTDDQDLSITLSGISGGKLTITNEEEQRARTGQSAEEAAASVNTNVKTGQSVNALEKTWDTDKMLGEMQANLEIAEAFTREADQFRANQAKELDQLKLDMKKLEDGGQTHSQEYMDLKAAYEQQNRIWGKGGIGSLVTTALTGALSGNVSGSTSDLLQNAAVNVIQGLGAGQIKDLITHLGKDSIDDGDALRAALQGILGCASASAQGGDCGTGAFGAAGAVIINKVIEDYFKGKEPEGMTEQEKQDRINLVNTIIIGITEAVGGDANLAKVTATIEMENNHLTLKDLQEFQHEITACKSKGNCDEVKDKLFKRSEENREEFLATCNSGGDMAACKKKFFDDDILFEYGQVTREALEKILIKEVGDADIERLIKVSSMYRKMHVAPVLDEVNMILSGRYDPDKVNANQLLDMLLIAAASSGYGGKAPGKKPTVGAGGKGSTIPVPNQVTASNGLKYQSHSKHTAGMLGNKPNAGIEPKNSLLLFEKSIPSTIKYSNKEVRYAADSNGNIHRFQGTNGEFHWSGSTGDAKNPLNKNHIPNNIKKELKVR